MVQQNIFGLIWNHLDGDTKNKLVMTPDIEGNLPLHLVARSNYSKYICERFVKDLDTPNDIHNMISHKNRQDRTALHEASETGCLEIFKCLWENISNPSKGHYEAILIPNNSPITCLHLAAAAGQFEVVHFLLEKFPCGLNRVDTYQRTALHLACQYGHKNIVEYLLKQRALVTLRDYQLYNCLEVAIVNHHQDIVEILLAHESWHDMMCNAQPIEDTCAYDTPMRKLIRHMPYITVELLTKKLTRVVGGKDQQVFKTIYDYEFFEDEFRVKKWHLQSIVCYKK
ncbi:unnamed protein product [Rotaria sp. Silwood2]|nr:unnamed protein product [Rotaria sp. Silwood2]CAF3057754.1 unnamed protein product [Rotaria sp. Silwood2]CAF3318825.1 unnamed protein product [Rotaria sp. Silwood2]CAF3420744.1 unnamed protein product [Rotaria sp. Silwood2]CAF4324952.1 unnamed protein product [Rotaria sp. Silwood2]